MSQSSAALILVLNGPNINLLGTRQPEIYGSTTLADIERDCRAHAETLGFQVECHQSNHEGQLVDWIQSARGRAAGIVINPGAYTHTSIALLDALLGVEVPTIEVHLSNIFQRDAFRHHSYVSQAARGVICGLGAKGYLLAIEALAHIVGGAPSPEAAR